MKRSEALAPLSRDHHVALEVALRLRRSEPDAAERFRAFLAADGRRHFALEEELLLDHLTAEERERMVTDHLMLSSARPQDDVGLQALGERLNEHVRWEERELFPRLEAELPPERLAAIGAALA